MNPENECSVSSCEKKAAARGLCPAHYQRRSRGWSMEDMEIPVRDYEKRVLSTCTLDGCQEEYYSQGLCFKCYQRIHRIQGAFKGKESRVPRTCCVPGCERPYFSSGFCSAHYQRNRLGISMESPVRERSSRSESLSAAQ